MFIHHIHIWKNVTSVDKSGYYKKYIFKYYCKSWITFINPSIHQEATARGFLCNFCKCKHWQSAVYLLLDKSVVELTEVETAL